MTSSIQTTRVGELWYTPWGVVSLSCKIILIYFSLSLGHEALIFLHRIIDTIVIGKLNQ